MVLRSSAKTKKDETSTKRYEVCDDVIEKQPKRVLQCGKGSWVLTMRPAPLFLLHGDLRGLRVTPPTTFARRHCFMFHLLTK